MIDLVPLRYRKKPVVIEAVRFDGSWTSAKPILGWIESTKLIETPSPSWSDVYGGNILIYTLEGIMTASPGDWIIKGVANEFYPCKDSVFQQSYEVVDG